jgi:hypothetical protein
MRSMVVLTIVLAAHGFARAEGEEQDTAKADRIFDEAQKLKQAGQNAQACAKYDEALRYNRSAVGTILNVGLCNEEANKVATALEMFRQARDLAREHGMNEHRQAAEEHIVKLEPLVPHLTVAFAELAQGTKLVIDDKAYPITSASDIRIDPGARHLVVTAPGRLGYETTVEIKASEHKAVAIPKLRPPVTVKKTRRTIGKLVMGSGIALVGTGLIVGVIANSKYETQFEGTMPNCTRGNPPQCNPEGFSETRSARTLGTVGTAVGITGGAAIAIGAYLWLFAPKDASSEQGVAVRVLPTLSPDTAGFAAVGHF